MGTDCIIFLAGIIIGVVLSRIFNRLKVVGTLKFIKDDDGEYIYAELERGLSDIHGKKIVKFNVDDSRP